MKKLLPFLLFACFQRVAAQNLVTNPSFEEHISCAIDFDDMPYYYEADKSLSGWTKPTLGTSDYFNSCAPELPGFGVPANFCGRQSARTGNAYAGGIAYSSHMQGAREYLQGHLTSKLIAGHRYYGGYWVSLAEGDRSYIPVPAAGIDHLGAFFSVLPEAGSGTGPLTGITPQVTSPAGLAYTDTAGWTNVSGVFTASGNEEWMILGIFAPDDSLYIKNVVIYQDEAYAYYYYDDVCVLDMEGLPASSVVHDITFCGRRTLNAPDNAAGFLWDDGSTGKDRIITQPGTYWVKSVKECTLYADTFKAIVKETLPPQLGNDTVMCPGDSIIIDASNPDYQQYRWNTGAVTPAIRVDTPGTYTVTIISECLTASDSITIKPVPAPEAFLPEDKILCDGTPLWLYLGQRNVKFAWNTGDTSCCIELKKEGSYIATVTNTCGASASDTINISYSGCHNCVLIPTAFSPNGDGLNDLYQVMTNCTMKSYLLEIYNRWGQAVFRSRVPNEGWDGKVSGIPVEKGVYFYRLHAVPAVDLLPVIDRKGDITVVR